MSTDAKSIPEPGDELQGKQMRTFGQNLLGIKFLADDWEKDIPFEDFLGGDEENLCGGRNAMGSAQVNLYEAKTQLSALVDRAAKGEEIVIAKAGKPIARLSALRNEQRVPEPLPFGQNLLGLPKLPESFYEDIPIEYFLGDEQDPLREVLR